MEYRFEVGQIVIVENVRCEVVAREFYDNQADYLCVPLSSHKSIMGEEKGGSCWCREYNILESK